MQFQMAAVVRILGANPGVRGLGVGIIHGSVALIIGNVQQFCLKADGAVLLRAKAVPPAHRLTGNIKPSSRCLNLDGNALFYGNICSCAVKNHILFLIKRFGVS